jgi:thiosulfate/3-mercaptopyruvate sulfurtransferase
VWWTFRVFGHQDVAVLDGGLPKWLAEGRPVDDEEPDPRERHFTGRRNAAMVRDVTQIAGAAKLRAEQIVDARAPGRFRGEAPEPRAGLRAGHIPGSKNVHYAALLNLDGTMKDVDATRALFEAAGVDLKKPVVTTCGSGVTAAILTLALHRMGHTRNALYDGSWVEWGSYPDLAIEIG